ncbi:MAG: ATP-binding protein [Candidatus Cloacimonadota bacterium]|nr:ATP-binding protein [Candidatus Cloacimonadota bacterium]
MLEKHLFDILQKAIETLRLGITVTNLERKIIYVNPADAKMHGYSVEELYGTDAIIYSTNKEREKASLEEIQRWNGMMRESSNKRKDGSTFPVRLISEIIKDETDIPIAIITICEDITHLKELEEQIISTKKMEYLRILTSGVAHDFNNILTGLLNGVQIAEKKISSGEEITSTMDFLHDSILHAKAIFDNLFSFSKGNAELVKQNVNISDFIRKNAELVLKNSIEKYTFNCTKDSYNISVDKGQLAQVVQNIILNAAQSMPDGGKIEVIIRQIKISQHEKLTPGKYIELSFQDQGEGISKENIARIFTPLFSTKKDGNGLGLVFSKLIIENHGGNIEVESCIGEGTTFKIYLPANEENKFVVKEEVDLDTSIKNLKILLVEDDEFLINIFSRILSDYDIIVDFAKTGMNAVKKIKEKLQTPNSFDLVVIDLNLMNSISGTETIEKIREVDSKVKSVITSGDKSNKVIKNFSDYGFSAVLNKPYTCDDIIKIINRLFT